MQQTNARLNKKFIDKVSIIKEKNLKVIAFSGKQEAWKFWKVKFLASTRVFEKSCWKLSQYQWIQRNST